MRNIPETLLETLTDTVLTIHSMDISNKPTVSGNIGKRGNVFR